MKVYIIEFRWDWSDDWEFVEIWDDQEKAEREAKKLSEDAGKNCQYRVKLVWMKS